MPTEPYGEDAACRTCGHPASHHDAGECWTLADGRETFGETSCPCWWLDIKAPSDNGGHKEAES